MGCAERRASTSQPGARRATRARCNSRVGVTVHELCRPTCPSARTRGSLAARPYRLHIPMRHLRTDEAFHEPERRTPMRLDGNYFASSRIGVRRSDQVHGPNARPKLEVEASHEPERRTPMRLDGNALSDEPDRSPALLQGSWSQCASK